MARNTPRDREPPHVRAAKMRAGEIMDSARQAGSPVRRSQALEMAAREAGHADWNRLAGARSCAQAQIFDEHGNVLHAFPRTLLFRPTLICVPATFRVAAMEAAASLTGLKTLRREETASWRDFCGWVVHESSRRFIAVSMPDFLPAEQVLRAETIVSSLRTDSQTRYPACYQGWAREEARLQGLDPRKGVIAFTESAYYLQDGIDMAMIGFRNLGFQVVRASPGICMRQVVLAPKDACGWNVTCLVLSRMRDLCLHAVVEFSETRTGTEGWHDLDRLAGSRIVLRDGKLVLVPTF